MCCGVLTEVCDQLISVCYMSKITTFSLPFTICLHGPFACTARLFLSLFSARPPCPHLLSVFCGYVTASNQLQPGKRKKSDLPAVPPPAKSSFRSTECLLLSLLRQGSCDETESPMREVLGGRIRSRLAASERDESSRLGGSCTSLSTVLSARPQTRSCSLETILDTSALVTQQQLFPSTDSLASRSHSSSSQDVSPAVASQDRCSDSASVVKTNSAARENAPGVTRRKRSSAPTPAAQTSSSLRPHSVGSCLDLVVETREEHVKQIQRPSRATSCLNVNNPESQHFSSLASHPHLFSSRLPSSSSHQLSFPPAASETLGSSPAAEPSGPTPASSTSNLWPAPAVVRRCFSSLDVSKPPRPVSLLNLPVRVPARNFQLPQPKPEHSKTPLPVCLLLRDMNLTSNLLLTRGMSS